MRIARIKGNNMSNGKAPRTNDDREFDRQVGRLIRSHRLASSLTQTQVAAAAGVTFQQLQKYERGTNRVAASRLASIAKALGVPPSTFLDHDTRPADGPRDGGYVLSLYGRCTVDQQRVVREVLENFAGE